MFLMEPPRTAYDLNFRMAGVPVRVHPLFWLITALLAANRDTRPIEVLIWVVAVFISILIHEFGHAVMIRYYGWRPRIILYSFGGLAAYEPTWHRMWPQVVISLAGPMAGFILAALVALAIRLGGNAVWIDLHRFPMPIRFQVFRSMNLNEFIFDMFFVNLFWGCVNLLPIYPLDGGRISQEILNHFNPSQGVRQSLLISVFAAAAMALVMYARFGSFFSAIFFGYFAVINYQMLQQYSDRFGGRGW